MEMSDATWNLISIPPKERCTVEILNGMGDLEIAEYVKGEYLAWDGEHLVTRNPTHWRIKMTHHAIDEVRNATPDSEACRAAFEEWFSKTNGFHYLGGKEEGIWQAFQAAWNTRATPSGGDGLENVTVEQLEAIRGKVDKDGNKPALLQIYDNLHYHADESRDLRESLDKALAKPIPPADGDESSGEMLQRLGMDGKLWAEEMHKHFPQIPEDDLLGWCCNMIMAGYDEAMRRATKPTTVTEDRVERVEWLPIESAPMDGTRVLIILEECNQERWVDIAKYGKERPIGCHTNWQNGYGQGYSWNPTHWMPLPKPPAMEVGE